MSCKSIFQRFFSCSFIFVGVFFCAELSADGFTATYYYAGPLKYVRHEGSRPISFVWELEHALSAKAMVWAGRIN